MISGILPPSDLKLFPFFFGEDVLLALFDLAVLETGSYFLPRPAWT
jgi:hypothetical protein